MHIGPFTCPGAESFAQCSHNTSEVHEAASSLLQSIDDALHGRLAVELADRRVAADTADELSRVSDLFDPWPGLRSYPDM